MMERSNIGLAALFLAIFAVGASDASARNCPNYWVDGTFVDMGNNNYYYISQYELKIIILIRMFLVQHDCLDDLGRSQPILPECGERLSYRDPYSRAARLL